ncbi:MAG TPA: beta-galactosidase [Firmicutes bacterium]|nr:beta-galactosidase [Bacillota bacterium]
MDIRFGKYGIYLQDKRIPFYSGTMHYWRIERALWPEILDKVKAMGFKMIETYIPWGVHEIERGRFDFGETNPSKDIDAFLSLCEEKGFHILVRPGPHINAELTYFGYPERVIEDPRFQARTASGTPAILTVPPKPFPIPSYACDGFYEEVAVWFDAICPIIAKHQYPQGGIIAIQSDNENSYFFKLTPYDVDYSDASVALYRRFLAGKYESIARLNSEYRTRYSSFDEIEPPRDFTAETMEEIPYFLDWAEYKEFYLNYGLKRIADMYRQRGITGIPVYHNLPAAYNVPFNQVRTEEVLDLQGVDLYPHKESYSSTKKACQYIAGTSKFPMIPEFGAGIWAWDKPIMPEDQFFNALTALMHGVKGFNYYMIVERERWLGSPVTRDGRVREPYFEFYRSLLGFLNDSDFASYGAHIDVLLLLERDYDRLDFASRLLSLPFMGPFAGIFADLPGNLLVSERKLGFEDAIAVEKEAWQDAFFEGLTRSHYAFRIGDSESPVEVLQQYRVVVCPAFEFMSEGVQAKLLSYVEGGGTLVMGPRMPRLNEFMQPCSRLAGALGSEFVDIDIVLHTAVPVPVAASMSAQAPAPGTVPSGATAKAQASADISAGIQTQTRQVRVYRIGKGTLIHIPFVPAKSIPAGPGPGSEAPALGVSAAALDPDAGPDECTRTGTGAAGAIVDAIMKAARVDPLVDCDNPDIDFALHIKGDGVDGGGRGIDGRRKLLFTANPTARLRAFSFTPGPALGTARELRPLWPGVGRPVMPVNAPVVPESRGPASGDPTGPVGPIGGTNPSAGTGSTGTGFGTENARLGSGFGSGRFRLELAPYTIQIWEVR